MFSVRKKNTVCVCADMRFSSFCWDGGKKSCSACVESVRVTQAARVHTHISLSSLCFFFALKDRGSNG